VSAERPSPSTAPISLGAKGLEYRMLLRSYVQRAVRPPDLAYVMDDIAEYDELLRAHGGVDLRSARAFEIGYGARPYRLIALQSMGVEIEGVDAEQPILRGTPAELRAAWRANGPERAVKSLIRRMLFDPRERAAFRRELASRGVTASYRAPRLHVSDAAEMELADGSLDLVLSEEVFQSVELSSLQRIVPAMARWLRPGGLALVRPNVFTGITGGLLQEWSRWSLANPPRSRRSEPWEHLRRDRFKPNTHANGLTRADYRELFAPHFELVEERVKQPELGREHYTPEVAAELAGWPEEELFSNCTLFVLRKAG
jgi:SAM-dependent methyltransferase